jgi:anti-sigma factor RsiW
MSLPNELIEQLLSGYLDDALSADERARVEQLLQTDEQIANELVQLREIRASLKAVAKIDSTIRLDNGFADRVLDAAVARARAEGLSDEHPLVRLAEQPSTSTASGRSTDWRVAGLLIGLAASIVMAVVAFRPSNDDLVADSSISGNTIAQVDQVIPDGTIEAPLEPVVDPTAVAVTPAVDVPETAVVPDANPQPMEIVSTDTRATGPGVTPTQEPEVKVASSDVPAMVAIMVLDVRLTDAGRESGAVRNAMELASLQPSSKLAITKEIAEFASKSYDAATAGNEATVLFLQAPATKLDSFYLQLMSDQVGVKSVGLTISSDAPILAVANSIAVEVEPTAVRHSDRTLELLRGEVTSKLAHEMSQLTFIPMNRDVAAGINQNGPDVLSQIMVLVR